MINKILTAIFNLVISLVNFILVPIDSMISSAIPGFDEAFDMIGSFFEYLSTLLPWVISWLGVNQLIIEYLVLYLTFKLTMPLAVHTIKLAIKWYDKLKP